MIPIHLEVIFLSLVIVERANSADKWVWGEGSSGRSSERDHQQVSRESLEYDRKLEGIYSNERPSSRPVFDDNASKQSINVQSKYGQGGPLSNYKYEVYENGFGDYKPPSYRPSVPFASPNRPIPAVSKPSALPISVPSRPNPSYGGPQGAASSVGILTGPVPSWENAHSTHKNGDPTQFERCKCSFSFNCKAPGIQFGNCDVGKQYCCYNSKGANTHAGFGSHLDVDRTDSNDRLPAILAGPGGPVDNYNLAGPGPEASVDYPGSIPPYTKRPPNPFGPPPPPYGGPPPFGTGPPPPPPPTFGGRPPLPPPPPPTPEELIFPPPNRPYSPFGANGPNGPYNRPPPPFYDYQSRSTNVTKIVSENASTSDD